MNIKVQRILGNWLVSFLSPLAGGGTILVIPDLDPNVKVLLTALVSSLIVTGIVVGNTIGKR